MSDALRRAAQARAKRLRDTEREEIGPARWVPREAIPEAPPARLKPVEWQSLRTARKSSRARAKRDRLAVETADVTEASVALHEAYALGLRYTVNRYPGKCSQCQCEVSVGVGYAVKYADWKSGGKTKWQTMCDSIKCVRRYIFPGHH